MARSTPVKPGSKASPKASAKQAVPRRGSSRGTVTTIAVVFFTALAVTALPLCILLIAGMLPTGVAIVVDRNRKRYLARAVGAMNLAGVLPGALQLWGAGLTFSALHHVIGSPFTWLAMYGAAALGWMVSFAATPVARLVIDAHADETRRRLENRAQALIEEWGEEVTGHKPK